MAANIFDVSLSVSVHAHLWGGSFESTPGVEATHEAVGLVSLPHQSQLPGVFSVLRAHVLDVNLGRRRRGMYNIKMFELKCAHTQKTKFLTNLAGFETKFDLHLAGLSTDPHVHLSGKQRMKNINKFCPIRLQTFKQICDRLLPLGRYPAAWCHHQPSRPDRSLSTSPTRRNNPSHSNTWKAEGEREIISETVTWEREDRDRYEKMSVKEKEADHTLHTLL